jgi:hypothetical protein
LDNPSEYANSNKPEANPNQNGAGKLNIPATDGRALVPDYVIAAYPAAPPMPTGLTAPTLPVTTAPAPVFSMPVVPPPTPAPAPAPTGQVPPLATPKPPAPPPAEDLPADGPGDSLPVPQDATGDQPAGSDTQFPPVGGIASAIPFLDNLELRFNLGDWSDAATRLLDGLDAVAGLPDAESPWARLGYWALVVGTVGVTVELTRQGLRARQPEPASGPPLPVRR